MPLYMDFHKIPGMTLEDARKAHAADEGLQEKYGVKYLQYWVNEVSGTIFCLVEGPDKKTCETVHRESHGHVACAMVEVDPSYYALIMGDNNRLDMGLVKDKNGAVDLGYRSLIALHLQPRLSGKDATGRLRKYEDARNLMIQQVARFEGRPIEAAGDDALLSVYNSALQAVNSAKEMQRLLSSMDDEMMFSIGLSAGQPVTENNEFIEETIRRSRRLSYIADHGLVMVSSLIAELTKDEPWKRTQTIRVTTSGEETFLDSLFETVENNLASEEFNIEGLARTIGISRPQLYRRIQSLTGRAPNDLIRDLRMQRAMTLLRRKSANISEVAFEVGFSNPSYFAKCFSQKFGCSPSEFLSIAQ